MKFGRTPGKVQSAKGTCARSLSADDHGRDKPGGEANVNKF
jgi:hypothetical protein